MKGTQQIEQYLRIYLVEVPLLPWLVSEVDSSISINAWDDSCMHNNNFESYDSPYDYSKRHCMSVIVKQACAYSSNIRIDISQH